MKLANGCALMACYFACVANGRALAIACILTFVFAFIDVLDDEPK